MLWKGLLVCFAVLASAVSGCGGESSTPEAAKLEGNASEKIASVTLVETGQVAQYVPGPMPISGIQCSGSGAQIAMTFTPGQEVSDAFGSQSATAQGVLVGVAGRYGYYELSCADRSTVTLRIGIAPGAGGDAFRVVVEPKIAGTVRAPYFLDLTAR